MAQKSNRKKAAQVVVPALPESSHDPVQDTAEGQTKLAESQLEMARLFIERGKIEIARRRLDEIVQHYPQCATAGEALKLLKQL